MKFFTWCAHSDDKRAQGGVETHIIAVFVPWGQHNQPMPVLLPFLRFGIPTPGAIFVRSGILSCCIHPWTGDILKLTMRTDILGKKTYNDVMKKAGTDADCPPWFCFGTYYVEAERVGWCADIRSYTGPDLSLDADCPVLSSPPSWCHMFPIAPSLLPGLLAGRHRTHVTWDKSKENWRIFKDLSRVKNFTYSSQ